MQILSKQFERKQKKKRKELQKQTEIIIFISLIRFHILYIIRIYIYHIKPIHSIFFIYKYFTILAKSLYFSLNNNKNEIKEFLKK